MATKKQTKPWPVGVRIEGFRWLNQEELSSMGWSRPGVVLLLEDGGVIFASADEEGNDTGALMVSPPGAPADLLHPGYPPP
jgi:hypothetical protein